jgi:hypothetical protein
MSALNTIESEAEKGDPEAWKMLADAAPGNKTVKEILLRLEASGARPIFVQTMPDKNLIKLPKIREFVGNLITKIHERKVDRGNGTLGV